MIVLIAGASHTGKTAPPNPLREPFRPLRRPFGRGQTDKQSRFLPSARSFLRFLEPSSGKRSFPVIFTERACEFRRKVIKS